MGREEVGGREGEREEGEVEREGEGSGRGMWLGGEGVVGAAVGAVTGRGRWLGGFGGDDDCMQQVRG